jgi:hypothetical protein
MAQHFKDNSKTSTIAIDKKVRSEKKLPWVNLMGSDFVGVFVTKEIKVQTKTKKQNHRKTVLFFD